MSSCWWQYQQRQHEAIETVKNQWRCIAIAKARSHGRGIRHGTYTRVQAHGDGAGETGSTFSRSAVYGGDQCLPRRRYRDRRSILRDLVNATVGLEELGGHADKPSKSLHRMLAPDGNPGTGGFLGIVNALQRKTRVSYVTAKAS